MTVPGGGKANATGREAGNAVEARPNRRGTSPPKAPIPPLTLSLCLSLCLSLGLGALGGALFFILRMPLAWMIGAMIFTTIAALSGIRLAPPGKLRAVMIAVLGLMLGSAFTPETMERAAAWTGSLAALLAYVTVVTAAVALLLRRGAGYSTPTAYFSAAPGGFTEMVLTGGAMGGDERVISLMHSVRVLLAVLIIPFGFRWFGGYEPGGVITIGASVGLTPIDAAVLAAVAVTGAFAARWARVPAPYLVGPMLLSAAVHLGGVTTAGPPGPLVAIAQVVIGTTIGCRFTGVSIGRLLDIILLGSLSTLFMLATAAAAAWGVEQLTGLPFQALLLAFSPGGLAEMSLISLAMGIDTAFVSTHHLLRICVLVIGAPLVYRLLAGRV